MVLAPMSSSSVRNCLLATIAMLLPAAIGAVPTAAQELPSPMGGFQGQPRLGLGYVVNAPHMYLGFSAFGTSTRWGGIGLYVDAKFDIDSPADEQDYIDSLTVQIVEDEIGDRFFDEEDEWRSFNIAVMRPLSRELMVYAGAGYAERERYWQYVDESGERGIGGFYWVRNTEESGGQVNFLGGAFFRIGSNLALQFGVESTPLGATVGAAYSIPWRR